MPNVRDYFRKKEKRDEKTSRISYKEKIKSHKFMVFYRSILIFILIIAIAVALFIQWQNKIYTEATVISTIESSVLGNAVLEPFAGNLLSYSKDGASCTNAKGTTVWNVTFEMQNPRVDICRDVVAIGDYNGREIYVMNTGGLLGEIMTNKPIRNFCVSANGVVAAVLDDSDVTSIYLYDTNGQELVHFRTTMGESGYPFSVSISPNGELVCVAYLFADSGIMKSSVAFYNFGEVGKNSTDNYVSGYDYRDDVVAYTKFWDERTAFAVSDDRIMFYSGAQKPVSIAESLLSEEVQQIVYGDDYVGLVFISMENDSRYRLDIYNKSGTLSQSININIEYSDIVFSGDQIIVYNESECSIYNINGVEKFSGLFSQTVYTLIPTSSSYRYLLVTPDSLDTIELK